MSPTTVHRSSFRLALLLVMGAGLIHHAAACSVPVFRYALDRWAPDLYQLNLPAGTEKDPQLAPVLKELRANAGLNLEVATAPATTNAACLMFPAGADQPAWTGSLTPEKLHQLTDSPARREILKRILSGESGIWVLVESGDAKADAAATEMISKRLDYLASVAKLPEIDPNDPSNNIGPGPELQVKFSLFKVRRNDPAESALVTMLIGPAVKSAPPADQPLVALVFGRGRVLASLLARDLNTELIDEMSLFLIGGCSCQVKEQNMGWDLLLAADWESELTAAAEAATKAATTTQPGQPVINPNSAAPETVVFHGVDTATPGVEPGHKRLLITGGVAILLAFAAWFGSRYRRH